MIYLYYNSPWNIGGSTTFTIHLKKVLGDKAAIIRLGQRTESKLRPLGNYGIEYHIMSEKDIRKLKGPIILTASHPKFDCYLPGMFCVFHDPNEFALYPHWKSADKDRVICIRETGLRYFPKAEFIPHPYMRSYGNEHHSSKRHAISTARFSSIKHTDMILEANMQLPKAKQCIPLGLPNRMWIHRVISKRFPNYVPNEKGFPKNFNQGAHESHKAKWNVDLSVFKDDGGGTQYTLLEAMDAGCVPLLHKGWTRYPGPAKDFGPSIYNVATLIDVLKTDPTKKQIEKNWEYLIKTHNPASISKQYVSFVNRRD